MGSRSLVVLLGLVAGCDHRALPPDPGAPCELLGHRLSEVRILDGGEGIYREFGGLVADGASILYGARRTTGSNSAADLDLFRLDARSGRSDQLTLDELDTALLDARQGEVLYAERSAGGAFMAPFRLRLRRGAETVELGEHALQLLGYYEGYAEADRRLLDGGTVAWATETAVHAFDGERTLTLASTKHATMPFVSAGTIVFAASDGKDSEIYRYRAGTLEQLSANELDDRAPVVVADEVLWRCGLDICRRRGTETEVVASGECSAPAAGGGSAAWGCAGRISRYTPGQPLETIARPGAKPTGVRVHGRLLAWIEAEIGDGYHEQGTLYFSDGARTQEVARVGLPCLYCDAYWPPLQLSLSDEALAWTYAIPSAPGATPGGTEAYVQIIAESACR